MKDKSRSRSIFGGRRRASSGGFYVSRQVYWPDGLLVVEVTAGGSDHASPDQLVPKYPGEAEEYDDPREAVKAAIKIWKLWREDKKKKDPEAEVYIAVGSSAGGLFALEPIEGDDEEVISEVKRWAQEVYESLPKCDYCGDLLPSDVSEWWTDEFGEGKYCSQYCAEEAMFFEIEEEE